MSPFAIASIMGDSWEDQSPRNFFKGSKECCAESIYVVLIQSGSIKSRTVGGLHCKEKRNLVFYIYTNLSK